MYCLDAATGGERWKVDSREVTFPGSHWNNILMASPIMADGKVAFGGGTLEQLFAGTAGYAGSTGRGFLVALRSQDWQGCVEARCRPEAGETRSACRC